MYKRLKNIILDSYQHSNNTLILIAALYKNDNTAFHWSSAVFGGRVPSKKIVHWANCCSSEWFSHFWNTRAL